MGEECRSGETREQAGPLIGSLLSYFLLHHRCLPSRFPHTFKWPFQKAPFLEHSVCLLTNSASDRTENGWSQGDIIH